MNKLALLSILTFALIQTASAQLEKSHSPEQEQNTQPIYLSKADAPPEHDALANNETANNTLLISYAICDKLTANTEFTSEGINISPVFNLKNAAEKKLRATAFFYYAEDTPMPAFFKGYSTSDAQLATWKDVQFCEDAPVVNQDSTYKFSLVMPYSKMGIDRQVVKLKYFVALFDGDEKIQETDWIFFSLDSRRFIAQEP